MYTGNKIINFSVSNYKTYLYVGNRYIILIKSYVLLKPIHSLNNLRTLNLNNVSRAT